MHIHSPIFHGRRKENKIRPITLIVWVLGRGLKKMPRMGKKNVKNIYCF